MVAEALAVLVCPPVNTALAATSEPVISTTSMEAAETVPPEPATWNVVVPVKPAGTSAMNTYVATVVFVAGAIWLNRHVHDPCDGVIEAVVSAPVAPELPETATWTSITRPAVGVTAAEVIGIVSC